MTRDQQRAELALIVQRAQAAGLKIRWHNVEIVVIGLAASNGDEQKDSHQPLHGEARQQGRSQDRSQQGPRPGEDAPGFEETLGQGQGGEAD